MKSIEEAGRQGSDNPGCSREDRAPSGGRSSELTIRGQNERSSQAWCFIFLLCPLSDVTVEENHSCVWDVVSASGSRWGGVVIVNE